MQNLFLHIPSLTEAVATHTATVSAKGSGYPRRADCCRSRRETLLRMMASQHGDWLRMGEMRGYRPVAFPSAFLETSISFFEHRASSVTSQYAVRYPFRWIFTFFYQQSDDGSESSHHVCSNMSASCHLHRDHNFQFRLQYFNRDKSSRYCSAHSLASWYR
ncbi:hypothetical protein K458DRAFT_75971 [Lentithecium fluviatile CBS 122367]|uniref:Uncharacterized protein n=1 Tax=Lentithecium fluviatile CBS 122367 TaxID=1168545 RepID=A0A6G1IV36_9PLEO|nr:hypothetical protein K458DRAFT_75971 [Lentithecium fluviatile CBS 122367]